MEFQSKIKDERKTLNDKLAKLDAEKAQELAELKLAINDDKKHMSELESDPPTLKELKLPVDPRRVLLVKKRAKDNLRKQLERIRTKEREIKNNLDDEEDSDDDGDHAIDQLSGAAAAREMDELNTGVRDGGGGGENPKRITRSGKKAKLSSSSSLSSLSSSSSSAGIPSGLSSSSSLSPSLEKLSMNEKVHVSADEDENG